MVNNKLVTEFDEKIQIILLYAINMNELKKTFKFKKHKITLYNYGELRFTGCQKHRFGKSLGIRYDRSTNDYWTYTTSGGMLQAFVPISVQIIVRYFPDPITDDNMIEFLKFLDLIILEIF